MLNKVDKDLLATIADLHGIPQGAYNIRKNGEGAGRVSTPNIEIITKEDKPGINVNIKPGTKNESVHIPVILTATGLKDVVYNSFNVGAGSDVLIVAGCGIHNAGNEKAQHDGIHDFYVGKGAHMKYVEKHYGEGQGRGEKVLNPVTIIEVDEDGFVELEMIQIKGVDNSERDTQVKLHKNAKLIVTERLLTYLDQRCDSTIKVEMVGDDASAQIISRSVAQNDSEQRFYLSLIGKANCRGHIQCDSIIMHNARVSSLPEIAAYHEGANLIHEAAIGKIESEQMTKLMSLGLSESEAEETILNGFLK